jgi:hypothetical protein
MALNADKCDYCNRPISFCGHKLYLTKDKKPNPQKRVFWIKIVCEHCKHENERTHVIGERNV